MAITVEAFTGSAITVSSASEISMINGSSVIATNSTAGIYQGFVDFNLLAAGDVFQFGCYEKTITGGTQRIIYTSRVAAAQASPIWVSPTLILGIGWDMTLLKISGTDRALTWRISKVA